MRAEGARPSKIINMATRSHPGFDPLFILISASRQVSAVECTNAASLQNSTTICRIYRRRNLRDTNKKH